MKDEVPKFKGKRLKKMGKLAKSIFTSIVFLLIAPFVIIGLTGRQPQNFPMDYIYILLAFVVFIGLTVYIQSIGEALLIGICVFPVSRNGTG